MTTAGLREQRKNRITGKLVGLYDGTAAEMDTADGRWQTVCEEHGTICSHRTLELANRHMADPQWCEPCQAELAAKAEAEAQTPEIIGNIYDALKYMLVQDSDYATEENAVGFNKMDTVFAHKLGNDLTQHGKLTPKQAKALSKLLRKYNKTQLQSRFDLGYKEVPTRQPAAKGARHEAQQVRSPNMIFKTINDKGELVIAVEFAYDISLVRKAKSVKGRWWNPDMKRNEYPYSPATYERLVETFEGFDVDDEVAQEFVPKLQEQQASIDELTTGLSTDAQRVVAHFAKVAGSEVAALVASIWARQEGQPNGA